jgi:hypothetical protein
MRFAGNTYDARPIRDCALCSLQWLSAVDEVILIREYGESTVSLSVLDREDKLRVAMN